MFFRSTGTHPGYQPQVIYQLRSGNAALGTAEHVNHPGPNDWFGSLVCGKESPSCSTRTLPPWAMPEPIRRRPPGLPAVSLSPGTFLECTEGIQDNGGGDLKIDSKSQLISLNDLFH